MKIINVVVIKGKEVEICTMPKEKQEKLADWLNTRALAELNYIVEKTA